MSRRYPFAIVKPGFNALATQTTSYLYNLFTWGGNGYGGLGLNNRISYSSPKQVGLATWNAVSANVQSTIAIKTDGTLWSVGYNANGELGQGDTINRSSPIQVGALTTWSSISSGGYHTLAVKTDGTLWAWGSNNYGQLGDNSVVAKSSPVQIGSLTNWLKIAGGYYSSVAVKTNGTLWSWGLNNLGQLGQTSTISKSSPVQVGALTNWSNIPSTWMYNMSATKTDGTLWTWGSGGFGGLGLGNTTNYSSPKQVGALTNWLKVAGLYSRTLSVKTDGTLWSWGYGNAGVLGLGNTTSYSSPKQVGSLTDWSNIFTSKAQHCLAIKTNGTLWAWGTNGSGELGLGNLTSYSSPKQVGASQTWSYAALGDSFSAALG